MDRVLRLIRYVPESVGRSGRRRFCKATIGQPRPSNPPPFRLGADAFATRLAMIHEIRYFNHCLHRK
jgi:hypothetical protein